MKWIMLIVVGFLISSCGYYTTEVVEYRQVVVVPVAPVIETVSYGVYGIQEPIDVTSTTIDYY